MESRHNIEIRIRQLQKTIRKQLKDTTVLTRNCSNHNMPEIVQRNNRVKNLSVEFKKCKEVLNTARVHAVLMRTWWTTSFAYEEVLLELAEKLNDFLLRTKDCEIKLNNIQRLQQRINSLQLASTERHKKDALPPVSTALQAAGVLITNPFLLHK